MMRAGTLLVTFTAAALSFWPVSLQAQQPVPCDEIAGYHELDFWIGEWEVEVGGQLAGTNRIEKILSGCAVMEHWRGSGGAEGKSLFFFNHVSGVWKQVWVTGNATLPGGLKEKTLLEKLDDGSVRFQGRVELEDARVFLDRTTLTPLSDGRVRQVVEISLDDGTTWQTRFDGLYLRSGPSAVRND